MVRKRKKNRPHGFFRNFFQHILFFLSGNRPVMVETNFTFGPNPKLDVFVFWFWLSFSQDLRLLGLLSKPSCMKKALQISSKTCFESPRMILHALWKKIPFQKSSMVFHYPRWPPHSGPKSPLRRNIYFSCNQFNFGCHIGHLCIKKCVRCDRSKHIFKLV